MISGLADQQKKIVGNYLNALKDYLSYEYQWRLVVENIGYDELLMQKSRDTYILE